MPDIGFGLSKQLAPSVLLRPAISTVRVRHGSLTSAQMRRLSQEGVPAIVKSTLIDQSIAGLAWKILSPTGKEDTNTAFYTMLLNNANDGEGAMPFLVRYADDILTTLQGGHFEIVSNNRGVPIMLYNVDSTTIYQNDDYPEKSKYPWVQKVMGGTVGDSTEYFTREELSHSYWSPVTEIGFVKRNKCPIEIAYYYICIMAAADDWNMDLLSDPFPAGVLALPGATQEEAQAFKSAWDYAVRGGDLKDIAVIYGAELGQAQHVKFTRPPTDMAFEITNHWYTSLIAASFEMSVLDISILTKVSTKAGAESQERVSAQQGQRKLRKVVRESIENWILPTGYQFKWEVPKPEDEETLAAAAERRARAAMFWVQAFGLEIGLEVAQNEGLIQEVPDIITPPEKVKSHTARGLGINADLRGYITFSELEELWNLVAFQVQTPPPDLWGQELFDWILDNYDRELFAALEIWFDDVEQDPELAALLFQQKYNVAIERAATRAYMAGKQRDADNWEIAAAIALLGFTIFELNEIRRMVDDNQSFFEGFTRKLIEEGADYVSRAPWRTSLYGKYLRRFLLAGVASMADADMDLIEIVQGPVKTDHCAICPTRWGTYSVEEYYALDPPPPSPNWCEGFDNCACLTNVLRGARTA